MSGSLKFLGDLLLRFNFDRSSNIFFKSFTEVAWGRDTPCCRLSKSEVRRRSRRTPARRTAARACAQHLKDLGHRRYAIVTFPLSADQYSGLVDKKKLKEICLEIPRRRIEGYLEVLEDGRAGSSAIVWECARANEESGRNAMDGILQTEPRPTAVLATSDRLSIGVIEAARRHLLRVPEDLAVVGFDDIPAAPP